MKPALSSVGLRLPSVAAINYSLHALIGDQISVREKRPVSFSPSALGPYWVSRLIDDEGHDGLACELQDGAGLLFLFER